MKIPVKIKSMLVPICITTLYVAVHAALGAPVLNGTHAMRICRPPPPYNATGRVKKACLVIGDSVSLGYTNDGWGKPGSGGQLAENMTGICDVLHAL